METVLESRSRRVVIGHDQPFCIIGERINPTGRKKLAESLAAGDFSLALADAHAQMAAGAHVLDVNAGVPLIDEVVLMREMVAAVQAVVDAPLLPGLIGCLRSRGWTRRVRGEAARQLGHG